VFESIEDIYNAEGDDYKVVKDLTDADIKLLNNKDTQNAQKILDKMDMLGGYAVDYDDERYPKRLRAIPDPPYVLYIRGNLDLNSEMLTLGVVGTRDYTDYGAAVAKKMSYSLARSGFTIVSGMARGADTFANTSALQAGRKTIAVIGSGVDVVYPPENVDLMHAIINNGAVVSEYPPGSSPLPFHFPERNRIISGLSDALLVTEAPKRSGALITARIAYETGKKVFSVPGSVFEENCVGTNYLIRAGMYAAASPLDITDEFSIQLKLLKEEKPGEAVNVKYPPLYERKNKKAKKSKPSVDKMSTDRDDIKENKPKDINDKRFSSLSDEEKVLIKILIENDRVSVDEIIRASEFDTAKVNSMLSLLEIMGHVRKMAGNYYVLAE